MARFTWNPSGFEAIRRSTEMQRVVEIYAARLANAAGPGFTFSSQQGRKGPPPPWNKKRGQGYQGRFRAIVFAETYSAMARQRRGNVLQKALHSMR